MARYNPIVATLMLAIRDGKKTVSLNEGLPAGSQNPQAMPQGGGTMAQPMQPGQRPPNPAQAGQAAAAAMQQVATATVDANNKNQGQPDMGTQQNQPQKTEQSPQAGQQEQKNIDTLGKGGLPQQTQQSIDKMVDQKIKEMQPLNTAQGRKTPPAPMNAKPTIPQQMQVPQQQSGQPAPGAPAPAPAAGAPAPAAGATVPESVDYKGIAAFTAKRYQQAAEMLVGESVDLLDPRQTKDMKVNAWKRVIASISEGKIPNAKPGKGGAMAGALGMMIAASIPVTEAEKPENTTAVKPDDADGTLINPDQEPQANEPTPGEKKSMEARKAAIKAGMEHPESDTVTKDGNDKFQWREIGSNPKEDIDCEDADKGLLEGYLDGTSHVMHKDVRKYRKFARRYATETGKEHVVLHQKTGHGEELKVLPSEKAADHPTHRVIYRVKPKPVPKVAEGLFTQDDRKAALDAIFGA